MEPIESCSGVYLIVNSINGHSYVGSSADVLKRVWSHLSCRKGSAIVAAAIRKHGRDRFFAFLLERADRSDLPARESAWIEKLDPEYNASRLTETGGKIISGEQREKIAASLKGRRLSADHRAAIGAGLIGRVLSPESRQKIAAAHKGRKHRPESRAKMGRPMTEVRRRRMRAAKLGKPWSLARRASHERRSRTHG